MIIIDTKQMFYHTVSKLAKNYPGLPITSNSVRPVIVALVAEYKKVFSPIYGEVVLAVDNQKKPWRSEYNPHYRWRRKTRTNSRADVDMSAVTTTYREIMKEFKESFPVKVIDVDHAEADDVIGVLVIDNVGKGRHLVVSIDHDFEQLLSYSGVSLFRPYSYDEKNILQGIIYNAPHAIASDHDTRYLDYKQVTKEDADLIRLTHIIKGDPGDDIPNILSPLSTFYDGVRQKTMTKKLFERFIDESSLGFTEPDVEARYQENRKLVDFELIKGTIWTFIDYEFYSYVVPEYQRFVDYVEEHELNIDPTLFEHA